MGVTTGGLLESQYQIITITIPKAPDAAATKKLEADFQAVVDAFNKNNPGGKIEVL